MFGLDILDVLIGLVFVYLLLSLICTGISELIAGLLDRRAANLEEGIRNLLGAATTLPAGPGGATPAAAVKLFYDHPLITSLREAGTKPSYIPAATFAAALTDVVAPASAAGIRQPADVRAALALLPPDHPIRRVLLSILDEAGDDLEKFRRGVEAWFNRGMERVSAWYKQRTQWWVAAVALVVVAGMNADSIEIADTLTKNASLRKALVAQAEEFVRSPPPAVAAAVSPPAPASANAPAAQPPTEGQETQAPGAPQAADGGGATPAGAPGAVAVSASGERAASATQAAVEKLGGLGLTFGWEGQSGKVTKAGGWGLYLFMKVVGLLVTTVAASLGAPFWFDLLSRFMSIRAVGKSEPTKPQTSGP